MHPVRRIILLVEATSAYGRGCLRGIARYANAQKGWIFLHRARFSLDSSHVTAIRGWGAHGVIARNEDQKVAAIISASSAYWARPPPSPSLNSLVPRPGSSCSYLPTA